MQSGSSGGIGISIAGRDRIISGSGRREDCIRIIEAGLAAADPARFMARHMRRDTITVPDAPTIKLDRYAAIYTVAFGKAADTMSRAAGAILQERLGAGIIVLPRGSRSTARGRKFRVINAGHPVPDHASVRAAKEAIKFLQARRDGELVIFLISGGGSALLALPDGVTLGEKIHATNLLLRCGATIREINSVRRCLSGVKGGRLAGHLRCDGIGLLMSDVEGDDPSVIASGPTHVSDCGSVVGGNRSAGPSAVAAACQDALSVLEKYGLLKKAGRAVTDRLRGRGRRMEPAPAEAGGQNSGRMIGNHVIARNSDCLEAMVEAGRSLGYHISDRSPLRIFGGIKEAADLIYDAIPEGGRECVIFGGEPTVRVLGDGKGGRNQELVLRLLKKMQRGRRVGGRRGHSKGGRTGRGRTIVASVGTDGIDGNSIYAGAMTEDEPVDVNVINDAIRRSDSGGFFERHRRGEGGGTVPPSCIRTGPTHTNLMDIGLVLT